MTYVSSPWTDEQVTHLNAFQQSGRSHPFTCGGEHAPGAPIIVAYEDGWHCPDPYNEGCDYRQDWAHSFMAGPLPPDPFHDRLQALRSEAS
jgi:hypothetical protein